MPTLRYVPLLVVVRAAVLPSTSPLAPAADGTAGTYRALIAGGVGDQFRDVAKVAEMPLPELAEDEARATNVGRSRQWGVWSRLG